MVEQTRRHAFIASLLGIPHLVVAVNKMDLVDYSEEAFDAVVRDFCVFRSQLAVRDTAFVPISALRGDNVVERSEAMPWYGGLALLEHLETRRDRGRPQPRRAALPGAVRHPRRRRATTAGTPARWPAACCAPATRCWCCPPSVRTTVASVDAYDGPLDVAFPPMSVTVRLTDELDVSRGDLICRPGDRPALARDLVADVCWMADAPLRPGGRYAIKHATHSARAIVESIDGRST